MTLQQAMLSLDSDLPKWVQVTGDVCGRCAIGFSIIILLGKVLVILL